MSRADQFRMDVIQITTALRKLDPADSRVSTRAMRHLIDSALDAMQEAVRLEYAALTDKAEA